MKAIVLGGGIGGMTSALTLLDQGIEVELYERAPVLGEIGAGLQIGANASRILVRLGLGEQLKRLGVAAESLSMRDLRTDRLIHSIPPNPADASSDTMTARYDGTFFQVHRPDLLAMLAEAVPDGVTHLGERAVDFIDDGAGVTVDFESGRQDRGDVLIGADGIHSMVRTQLQGEQELDFAHIVAWRALIPRDKLSHLDLPQACHTWVGPHRSAVVYWVHGAELLNFVGMVPAEEAAKESWTTIGEVAAMRASYVGCNPRLQAIIDVIDTPFVTGYYFRYPLTEWTRGRVTLLGDAAHPMHPFLAQGGCQAIEDAAVLGHVLAAHRDGDPSKALAEYERRRIMRASRVQNSSRTQERVWHMADPSDIVQRNRALTSLMEIDPSAQTIYGWLYTYDVDTEATKPLSDPASALKRPEAQRAWRLWATMLQPQDFDRGHHGIRDAYERFLLQNSPADPAVSVYEIEDQPPYVRVSAPGGGDGPVLLHLHGGGYVLGSANASRGLASRLAVKVGGTVVVPEYRRAPEHPYPAAVEDAQASYAGLLDRGVDPGRIVITGESAGGALAVALAMRLRDLELPRPAGVVAMCPMADLAVAGETVDTAAGVDPVCTRTFLTEMASAYLQGSDPRDPLASPVYGDYRGLAPLLVQVGDNEALYADATRIASAARRDGVDVELDTYSDTVHIFQLFDFLPESVRAIERVGDFVANVCQTACRTR
jgi:acetyl esterase/lipase/2-polyprenyl-6-methoxyphenol hydroxylase-like FAD-dependent oxidoreductase